MTLIQRFSHVKHRNERQTQYQSIKSVFAFEFNAINNQSIFAQWHQCVRMFPFFYGMRQGDVFVAEKPVFLGITVCGDVPVPMLFEWTDTNVELDLVSLTLPIVLNQFHGNQWRFEFEKQFLVEILSHSH